MYITSAKIQNAQASIFEFDSKSIPKILNVEVRASNSVKLPEKTLFKKNKQEKTTKEAIIKLNLS